MTEEHVWVILAGGKRLYVGQVPKAAKPVEPPQNGYLEAVKKRKRRQNPPPAPVEIFEEEPSPDVHLPPRMWVTIEEG